MGKHFKKLVNNRLYLSPLNADDYETIVGWLCDLDVAEPMDWISDPLNIDQYSEMKGRRQKDSSVFDFAVIDLESDKLIGLAIINTSRYPAHQAEIALMIGDPEFRGRGYGMEIIQLLLDYGFNYLNLHRIYLTCAEFNQAGQKLYRKAGFTETGRSRDSWFNNGKYYNTVQFDMLRHEFADQSYIKNKAY